MPCLWGEFHAWKRNARGQNRKTVFCKRADVDSLDYLLRSLPSHVGRQIKYTRLDPERRIEKTKRSLQLLERALLCHIIRSSNAEGLPLNAGASSKMRKWIIFM